MLISENDVENYKQIKSDLDELRLLVEKSELWVSKEKVEKKKKKDASGNGTVKEEVMQLLLLSLHLQTFPPNPEASTFFR